MNTKTGTRAAAALAAAALIASLAGCAGTASKVDTSSKERSLTDVAERQLALRPSSRTDVAERRLLLGEPPVNGGASVTAPRTPAPALPDVAERRQWMRGELNESTAIPDVAERRLWISH
ncbi:hypothetical protein BCL57_002077 [Agromyces flavus]|uniref:DUF3035 domain-containing protein n=1 Tax=Agromyces flavus TaxID=589382 RepID=A0A1H1PI78_9MICO|nr:hypothetical protein [Agromyces flavus]MCP2367918.1 hypothetical protein [Agromyces flavus]GGI47380.1 hypothetical protein GCM10010932_20680 [Agromyces flavus]SDS10745.1 hypothetical protein SAMN04489721_0786 [Agromyces flavus]